MLVDVPTRVTSPPSSETNDIGMSRLEGEVFVSRATRSATGIRIASAPTFLVGMDRRAVAAASTGAWLAAVLSFGRMGFSSRSARPVLATAREITREQAMITTTSEVKPVKAFLAGTMPTSTPASRAPTAMTS